MFGKEKTFEEITGMTEEEFRAQAAEVKALKASQSAKDAELTEFKSQFEQTKADLDALKNPIKVDANAPKAPTGFYEDPDKAFAERIAPTAMHTLNLAARVEEMTAKNKFTREYQLWGKEIDEMVSKHQNVADKGNPALYENIVNIVKGKHMDEILDMERKGQSLFTESGSGAMIGSSSESNHGLSKDQLDAAKRMGMTPDEFSTNYNDIMSSRGMKVGNA